MGEITKKNYKAYYEYLKDVLKICYLHTNAFLKNGKNNLMHHKILESNLKNSKIKVVGEEILKDFNFEEKLAVYLILFKTSRSKINLKINKIAQNLNQDADFDLTLKIASLDSNKNSDCFEKKLGELGIYITDTELPSDIFNVIMCNEQEETYKDFEFLNPDELPEKLPIREEFAEKIKNFLENYSKKDTMFFNLYGAAGAGKKTSIKRAAKLAENNVLIVDFKKFPITGSGPLPDLEEIFKEVQTNLEDTVLCAENIDIFLEKTPHEETFEKTRIIGEILELFKNSFKKVFLLTKEKVDFSKYKADFSGFCVECEPLNLEENIKIWTEFSEELTKIADVDPTQIANKFTITPGEIRKSIELAKKSYLWGDKEKLTKKEFYECIYSATNSTLSKLGQLIKEKYTWDDIVLDPEMELMLRCACDQIKYKSDIYINWGMKDKVLYGKGLSLLLTGSSGTGKTMAAQVVSSELGLDLYKIDLSRIVSKYIGETEKNLRDVFDEARKSNVILLFDEADVLFSKRTEIKDSHDRNANMETAFLLQKMEEHPGITILTTNLRSNIDDAFRRRITFIVDFTAPDNDRRKLLWQKAFPKNAKFEDDMDFDFLVEQFKFTGGSIRNVVLNTLLFAKRNGKNKIGLKEVLEAIKIEMNREGINHYGEFGKYEYLANPEMSAKPKYEVRGYNPYLDNLY